jgi:UDP-3-O-[3-hydroxymyristoyl] glucosamine N-acyltransferase
MRADTRRRKGFPTMMTAQEIAELVGGQLIGDPSVIINDGQALHLAEKNHLAFVSKRTFLPKLVQSNAGACIVPELLRDELPHRLDCTYILTTDAEAAFMEVLLKMRPQRPVVQVGIADGSHVSRSATIGADTNIHSGAHICEDVVIGDRCDIHPGVYIGPGSRIGDDVRLFPNVVVYHDVTIGNRVTIHAGSILGGDGFGYRTRQGRHQHIPHLGTVRVCDDVEVGATSIIDRGVMGATTIGEGTKIDNLVVIAHNCEVGKHNLLVSQVGFAGSVKTGDYVVCAGQVGVGDHVTIGDMTTLGAKTGVHKDLPGNQSYLGQPAAPAQETARQLMALKRLPGMRIALRELQSTVKALSAQVAELTATPSLEKDRRNSAA